MNYKILEHKADIKIKVLGKTLEQLFRNAALAMAEILYQKSKISAQGGSASGGKNLSPREISRREKMFKITKTILTKSADREILLIDFLNDILGESQINQAVYPEVRLIDFQPEGIQGMAYLKAEISGYPIERFDEDIKAVTYHDLSVRQNKNAVWEATVLFDV